MFQKHVLTFFMEASNRRMMIVETLRTSFSYCPKSFSVTEMKMFPGILLSVVRRLKRSISVSIPFISL